MRHAREALPAQARQPILDRFSITAEVIVRPCRRDDLFELEWDQRFRAHRGIIAQVFARHERGEVLMLVAEASRFPVGQIWIDFDYEKPRAAWMWAFRVIQHMRGMGIGERLLRAAEQTMLARGLTVAELGCEQTNTDARRFYENRGYRVLRERVDRYSYTTPEGETVSGTAEMWILGKQLTDAQP